jgi:hypothetical protein
MMPSKESRGKWNAEHYSQFKVSVEKELASAFKDACANEKASAAGVVKAFMREYLGRGHPAAITIPRNGPRISTRGDRRKEVRAVIGKLMRVRDAEEAYMGNIPDNMQGGARFEAAAQAVAMLEDALDALQEAY